MCISEATVEISGIVISKTRETCIAGGGTQCSLAWIPSVTSGGTSTRPGGSDLLNFVEVFVFSFSSGKRGESVSQRKSAKVNESCPILNISL